MKAFRTIILCLILGVAPLYADVKTESLHFLSAEAGIGYSALLHDAALGTSAGLAGGKLQAGYEWHYRKLMVHTGLEFSLISDKTNMLPFQKQISYTVGLPAGQYMLETFDFQSWSETQLMGQLNIPIQIGAIFADRYYFLAGARIGFPLLHTANTSTTVNTYLTDPTLIGSLDNVPVHDAYTSVERTSGNWAAAPVNAQLSAEIGLVLNSFFEPQQKGKGKGGKNGRGYNQRSNYQRGRNKKAKKQILYRIALFADYGLNSCAQPGNTTVELAQVAQPRDITVNNSFACSSSGAHSLLVGAKFAVLFQMNEPKPVKTKPKPPVTKPTNPTKPPVTTTPPPPPPADTPTIVIPIKVGAKVVLHNLFFATNKTQILPQSEQALNELAQFMQAHPGISVRITGHTDDVGSEQANQILSEGRANAVRTELIRRGVAGDRITAEGKGESEPIADNKTEEGRARNRRVEFTITATGDEDIEQIKD